MATATELYVHKVIDLQGKNVMSSENIILGSSWQFIRYGTYTVGSPFVVSSGNKAVLPLVEADIIETRGRNLTVNYDYDNQIFRPTTEGDVFMVEFRFKASPSNNAGNMDLILEIPSHPFNPVNGVSLTFTKPSNTEHYFSINFMPDISPEFVENGGQLFVQANGTDVSMYDLHVLFTRLASNKPE